MRFWSSDRGSQSVLAIGLVALNVAVLLVVIGASSLLVKQRAIQAVGDAIVLNLADWLRVNRDDSDVYPATWEVVAQEEIHRLSRQNSVAADGWLRVAGLRVEQDRKVSIRLCADSWLSAVGVAEVCADSAATQQD